MKSRDKLVLRASEIRTRLSELGGDGELNDETRGELDALRNEYGDVEKRSQALMISEDTPQIETHDTSRSDLAGRANVGEVFSAALEHRSTQGATAELQQDLGLQGNQVPLELLRDIEDRGVTPAPSDVGASQQPIIGYVFPQSVGAFLGVDMPTVPTGETVFTTLTKKADVHTPAESSPAAETTGAFSAAVLSPSRLQASFFYSREDRARFVGMDAALRMNLGDALSDGLDRQIIVGTNGLLTGSTNLDDHNVTDETDYAAYRSQLLMARIDGRFASVASDIRIVMGAGTYAHADAKWRGTNTNNDVSALDVLMAKSGGVRVSAHIPAVASTRQNAIVRRGMNKDMVVAVWEGISIIADEVTKAANGQIVVTAVMLFAAKILRKDGFFKQQVQHS